MRVQVFRMEKSDGRLRASDRGAGEEGGGEDEADLHFVGRVVMEGRRRPAEGHRRGTRKNGEIAEGGAAESKF